MAPATAAATAFERLAKPKTSKAPVSRALDQPYLYLNRELSLLSFQRRVLEEAQDPKTPLLERIKFLSIVGSNLDEFFMVRVAGLTREAEEGVMDCGPRYGEMGVLDRRLAESTRGTRFGKNTDLPRTCAVC